VPDSLFQCGLNYFFSFFGDFGFGFGGGGRDREHDIPKGGDVIMNLDVKLEELYSGNFIEVRHAETTFYFRGIN